MDAPGAEEVARGLGSGVAPAVPVDVSDERSVASTVSAVVARFGRIDALVNNAAMYAVVPVRTATGCTIRRSRVGVGGELMRGSLGGVLLMVASIVVVSCGGAALPAVPAATAVSAPTAAPTPTAAPKAKFTVSYSNVVASILPLWVAKEAGIFDKNGLDVEVVLIESTKGVAALLTGDTRFAHIGGSEIVSATAAGADLVIVAATVPIWPYVLLVAPEIKTAADLKGKSLAIAGVGGSYDIALRVALPRIGLTPDKDVTLIPTGSVANATAALVSGAVQGVMSQPPDTLVLEPKGFHSLINLATLKLPSAIATTTVTRAFLNANREVVQRYVDSIVEAIAKEKKDRAFTITVLKKYLKSTNEPAMNATYDHYVGTVIPDAPYAHAEQFADAIEQLGKKNEKVRALDVKKILDETFVRSAVDRGLTR